MAAEMGFAAACFCLPCAEDKAPDEVKCLVLLLKNYTPQDDLTDAFYIAKNDSFAAMKNLTEQLKSAGMKTWMLSNLHLKSIASRCGLRQGRNTLHYHGAFGSKFCLELIGLDIFPDGDDEMPPATLPCKTCRRCMDACPGGAITENGFVKENCIRFYMIGESPCRSICAITWAYRADLTP